ncbi:MAG: hypothetical protein LBR07_06570 [Puniceicoccales bacterium]|jgi:hypothetical protein|nr:hypothetical protein [Puniceicoccales bacterium]
MAEKFSKETIKEVLEEYLKEMKDSPRLVAEILNKLTDIAKEEDADAKKEAPLKRQFVVLLNDAEGKFAEEHSMTGWVVQIPETENVHTAVERITTAAYDYNRTRKGRKKPAENFSDACMDTPAGLLKEQFVWVKTKAEVHILPCAAELGVERTDKKVDRRRKLE